MQILGMLSRLSCASLSRPSMSRFVHSMMMDPTQCTRSHWWFTKSRTDCRSTRLQLMAGMMLMREIIRWTMEAGEGMLTVTIRKAHQSRAAKAEEELPVGQLGVGSSRPS